MTESTSLFRISIAEVSRHPETRRPDWLGPACGTPGPAGFAGAFTCRIHLAPLLRWPSSSAGDEATDHVVRPVGGVDDLRDQSACGPAQHRQHLTPYLVRSCGFGGAVVSRRVQKHPAVRLPKRLKPLIPRPWQRRRRGRRIRHLALRRDLGRRRHGPAIHRPQAAGAKRGRRRRHIGAAIRLAGIDINGRTIAAGDGRNHHIGRRPADQHDRPAGHEQRRPNGIPPTGSQRQQQQQGAEALHRSMKPGRA